MVAARLRKGKAADVRGADRLLAEALATVRAITPTATVVVRGDSKFYTADVVATAARYGAYVSLTTGSNPSITKAIATIGSEAVTKSARWIRAERVGPGDVLRGFRRIRRSHAGSQIRGLRPRTIQAALTARAAHRSAGTVDLLIAASAEPHGVTVLHHDRDFDRVSETTGQPTHWLADPGSLP